MSGAPRHVAAVDVGGTHTDAVLLSDDGRLLINKVRSTPGDPGAALVAAIKGLLDEAGLGFEELTAVVHGTTVATNAVIEGDYARVGLLVTAGFEDLLDIGTQQRVDTYDPWTPKPAALVPRGLVRGIRERTGSGGDEVEPLDEEGVRAAARSLLGTVDAVAIVFLFSFVDPRHERRAADIVAEELPGIPVSISSQVAPEFREYPRAATTVINAALRPGTGGYLDRLDARLRAEGFGGAFQLMTSAGGVIPVALAARLPATLLVSGPAAGAVAAAEIGRRLGELEVVMLDVGGTSADAALIQRGEVRHRYRGEAAGMPIALPQIDVLPVGAGGGSIASVDAFGSLAVGPESARADPGPAAYGFGELATVTDAHLVLGHLDPAGLLGGRLPLHVDRAEAAIDHDVAVPLGIDTQRAAASVLRIADGRMADALRMVSVVRGIDIRDSALMAFGGAGPLHACAIATELGMRRVVVPRYPGLTSALGLVLGEGRYDLARTFVAPMAPTSLARLDAVLAELATEAGGLLAEAGVAGAPTLSLDVDLRYAGQAYEITVPVGPGAAFPPEALDRVVAEFHLRHRSMYGHAWDDAAVELVTVRLRAGLPRMAVEWDGAATTETASAAARSRLVGDGTGAMVEYSVLDREDVRVGAVGPLIVQQSDTTTLIPRGWRVERVTGAGMVLVRGGEE